MKRITASAGMLVLIALALGAAVWDGSAVAGVSEDFPGDGLYGACNSFPRDTSVTLTNLENGKTVTVTITNGVENPGIFIALSPKAAAALDMRAGSAARIRAVALTASQAEATLPPTRAGETADPDYNPRVYVDREKAAVAAAAAAPAGPAETIAPATAAPAVAATPSTTVSPAAVVAPERAEVVPKLGQPPKAATAALPSLTEPRIGAAPPAAAVATTTPPATTSLPPPAVVRATPAQVSPVFPTSPKAAPLGLSLPAPDLPTIPDAVAPTPRLSNLAQAPEILGGSIPQPRKPAVPRLAVTEPALPGATPPVAAAVVQAAPTQPKPPEKASVTALVRPPRNSPPLSLGLSEPTLSFGPEELPEAILNRITAPAKVAPVPALAEATPPSPLASKAGAPEAIALERPSYSAAVLEAALEEAETPGSPEAVASGSPSKAGGGPESGVALDEAIPPGMPDAIANRRSAGPGSALAELQAPDVPVPSDSIATLKPQSGATAALGEPVAPTPQETIAAGNPASVEPAQAVAELAEPGVSAPGAAVAPTGPETGVALSAEKPALAASSSPELATPAVPSPSESVGGEKPATPKPGEAIVELQPAELRPPKATGATEPAQPPAVATIKGPTPSGVTTPPTSVPMISGLSKGSFYVQIGVYGTNDSLQAAITGFKSTYPLAMESLKTKTGSAAYRLFVGPLSRDESGVVLIRMRSLGFRDAYIRQGT